MEVIVRFMEREEIGLVRYFLLSAIYSIPKEEKNMRYILHLRKLVGMLAFYEVLVAENEDNDIVGIVVWRFNKKIEDATVIIHPYVWDSDDVERQILDGFGCYCSLIY